MRTWRYVLVLLLLLLLLLRALSRRFLRPCSCWSFSCVMAVPGYRKGLVVRSTRVFTAVVYSTHARLLLLVCMVRYADGYSLGVVLLPPCSMSRYGVERWVPCGTATLGASSTSPSSFIIIVHI